MSVNFYKNYKQLLRTVLISALVIFLSTRASADKSGYLVTKSGVWLTGSISSVYNENQILFINDFGTPYQIYADLIFGFVVRNQNGENELYLSKVYGGKCRFMKMIYQGERVNLFKGQIERERRLTSFYMQPSQTYISDEYFIEIKGSYPMLITRRKFRGILRRLFKRQTPELADKIGKRGYRYKDIVDIIKEFNKLRREKSYKL